MVPHATVFGGTVLTSWFCAMVVGCVTQRRPGLNGSTLSSKVPALHAQLKPSSVFSHTPCARSQSFRFASEHSSKRHTRPGRFALSGDSSRYGCLHSHVYEPGVSLHSAFAEQSFKLADSHSLMMNEHWRPGSFGSLSL